MSRYLKLAYMLKIHPRGCRHLKGKLQLSSASTQLQFQVRKQESQLERIIYFIQYFYIKKTMKGTDCSKLEIAFKWQPLDSRI